MTNIERTIVRMEKTIAQYSNPALMISFGKDSTMLWWMLRHLRLPIVCHQTPWQPERWAWAQKMIQEYSLVVYDWPPEWVALQEHDQRGLEIISAYTIGGDKVVGIRQKVVDTAGVGGVCGLHDCIRRPRGTIKHDWDLLICAQKDGDPDNFGGKLSIKSDIKQNPGAADFYFPMREWTDGEVWSHIERGDVPINREFYEDTLEAQGDTNPDIVSGCFDCMRRDAATSVECQRLHGQLVSNISAVVPYIKHDASI